MEQRPIGEARPRRRRLPMIVGIGVALLAVGWTAVWATARSRVLAEIDARLEGLAARGVVVACADRAVGGFPFRMELSCAAPGVEIRDLGITASAAALRVVAQVWDPKLVLIEIDGSAAARDPSGETAASWRTLRASLRWSGRAVERVSIAAEGLDVTTRPNGRPPVRLVAAHLEAHGRPNGERGSDLDLAASATAAAFSIDGKRLGPPTANASFGFTLRDILPPGPGPALPAFAARGGRIEPARVGLAVGELKLDGAGALRLDEKGVLDGSITLTALGLEGLAKGGGKELGPELTAVFTGFLLLGKPPTEPGTPGRRLEMVVDHGLVRIARLTLGRLPPLFGSLE